MSRALIDIEALLHCTYQKQVADKVAAKIIHGIFPQGYVSNSVRLANFARLGVRVDNPVQLFTASAEIHPDAEATHEAVMKLPKLEIGLIITHARAGDQPDWMPGAVTRCVPVLRANGKVKVEWDTRPGRRKRPIYCPVEFDPPSYMIEFQRDIYGVWYRGMVSLVAGLDALSSYQVTGPSAPAVPWLLDTGMET